MNDVDKVFGDDYEVPGQMSLWDVMDDHDKSSDLIAVSKVFAAAIKQMNLKEWKTFVYALTHIKWTESNRRILHLDKWKLVELLGIKSDPDHVTEHLRRAIGDLPIHSFIQIVDKDRGFWENGMVVTRLRCYKNYVLVALEEAYLPLFQELQKGGYITLWASDLFQMTSERSILFYESLRLHSDTRKTNVRTYGVKDLKTMFGIPKDGKGAYMRKDGHFDRPAFEKRVIQPLCDDLAKCQMLQLHILEDGKPWRKVHYHGRVVGYEFSWDVSDHPAIMDAAGMAELRESPEVLKIAHDIAAGKKKTKKKQPSFEQRTYDFEQMEKDLIKN